MRALRIMMTGLTALALVAGGTVFGQNLRLENSNLRQAKQQLLINQLKLNTRDKVRIKISSQTGMVNFIGTDPAKPIPQPAQLRKKPTAQQAARGFFSVYGPLFGLRDQAQELTMLRTRQVDRGRSFVRFRQTFEGIPVFGGECIVQVNASNNIVSANGKIIPDILVDTAPVINPETATTMALDIFLRTYKNEYDFDPDSLRANQPELWIYNPLIFGINRDENYLVWRIEVRPQGLYPIREIILVDALQGKVVLHFNQNPTAKNREIYDNDNTPDLSSPGLNLWRVEGQDPTGIVDVDKAYDYAGDTYDFYLSYHNRDSLDNAGMKLISTTRFCHPYYYCPFANAFWTGTPQNQMVYGQGYASADDVVGHEMTHGVTDFESNLTYYMQSGAINEALSDLWGEFIDLANGKGNDSAGVRWLMGEDLPGGAIRNMKNPPAKGDPDKMYSSNYYCGTCDQGGVHTNSGVANKAVYLMTDGGTFNGITVTGSGVTKVVKIFYEAQTNLLTASSDYHDLADILYQACLNLIGTDGITYADLNQVVKAIEAVEMNQALEMPVQNPGFEDGQVDWTEYSSGSYDIITTSAPTYCGNWSAYLGGYDDAEDYLYQDVAIPSDATQVYLQFQYAAYTYGPTNVVYDKMSVEIRNPGDNSLLQTLMTVSNRNSAYRWVKSTQYNLSAYKGQTIRLRFYVTTDVSYYTNFLIDDVVLKVALKYTPVITSFAINNNAVSTSVRTVTLNNTTTNSPTEYIASLNPDFLGAEWKPYSTAPSIDLSLGSGTKTVYFKVRNALDESLVLSDTIEALAPVVSTFKIANGAANTSKQAVTLNNTAANTPTLYKASEYADFSDAPDWQTYVTAPSFNLSAGSGAKTVYFKVRNVFTESAVLSDTIEALVPSVSTFKLAAGAASTSKQAVTLNNTATNTPLQYMASEDAGFSGASWQTYATAPSFNLSAGSGAKTVYFKVKNAFSESAALSDTIEALAPIVSTFKLSAGAASTSKQAVTLNNTATNTPLQYMASEDAGFSGASWQTYATAPSFNLSAGSGAKTVYFKVKNAFSESAALSDTIEALAPSVSTFKLAAGAASTSKQAVTLNNTATNTPLQYMASEDAGFSGASWQTYATAPSFNLSAGSGAKTVYFKVKNAFSESAALSDTIEALAPSVSTFKLAAGAASTSKQAVTLNNTATNTPLQYMASEDAGFSGASWQTYATAPSFNLSAGSGTKTVYFKVRNAFSESTALSDTIEALAPAVSTFKLSAGAASTSKQAVTLNNTATNTPLQYMASEDAGFSGATWQTYATAPSFNLSAGSGAKTVYFKVRNAFSESTALSDTIEALAPIVSTFKLSAGAASTSKQAVTLNNTATNTPLQYMASEDAGFSGASWQTYATAPSFNLSAGSGAKTVYFKVKNAFSESAALSDTIEALAPSVSTFKLAAGAASTSKQAVTLNNTATNTPLQYMASEDAGFSGATWQTYATAPSFNLSAGSGAKTVYFKVRNVFTESAVLSDTIEALAPSVSTFKLAAGAASTSKQAVTLNNTATNTPLQYMASEDAGFSGASWQTYATAPSFTLSAEGGTKVVYFKVKNWFMESNVKQDDINLLP